MVISVVVRIISIVLTFTVNNSSFRILSHLVVVLVSMHHIAILIFVDEIFFRRSAILDKSRNSLMERLSKRKMFWHCLGQFGLVYYTHICSIFVVQSHPITFTLRYFAQILLIKFNLFLLLFILLVVRSIDYLLLLRFLRFEIMTLLASEFLWWACLSSLKWFISIISLLWLIFLVGRPRALSLRNVSSFGSFRFTGAMSYWIRGWSQTWAHFFQQIFFFHLFVLIKVLKHGNLSF